MSQHAPTSNLPLFSPPEPNPEVEEKHRALEELEESELRARYLTKIRGAMLRLWRRRFRFLQREAGELDLPPAQRWPGYPEAVVTPDDAREYFEDLDPPGPEDLSRNFLASVFRGSEWEAVDTYKSRTEGSHANELKAYAWAGRPDV